MLRRLLLIALLVLLMYAPAAIAADVEAKTGTGMHIWFDTGGGFVDANNLSLIAPLAKKGLR
ncbi:MAG: hypothetical protein QM498_03935 [Desulfobacterium sp.]